MPQRFRRPSRETSPQVIGGAAGYCSARAAVLAIARPSRTGYAARAGKAADRLPYLTSSLVAPSPGNAANPRPLAPWVTASTAPRPRTLLTGYGHPAHRPAGQTIQCRACIRQGPSESGHGTEHFLGLPQFDIGTPLDLTFCRGWLRYGCRAHEIRLADRDNQMVRTSRHLLTKCVARHFVIPTNAQNSLPIITRNQGSDRARMPGSQPDGR
jgi:hypothetical protein